jgi:hypothetical protein
MKENKTPFDEHFNRRLSDHASSVPDDLFDRLQARRGGAAPSDTPVRERLEGHESPVSEHVFAAILAARERRKRRGIVFWRTAMGIAALWLLGAILWSLKNKNSEVNLDALNASKTLKKDVYTEGSSSKIKNNNAGLNASELIKNKGINSEVNAVKNESNKGELNALKTTKKGISRRRIGMSEESYTEGSSLNLKNKNSDITTIKSMSYDNNSKKEMSELSMDNSTLNAANLIQNNQAINGDLMNENVPLNSLNVDKNAVYTEESSSQLNERSSRLNSTNASLDFLNIMQPKSLILAAENNRKNPCSDPGNGCPTFSMRHRNMKGVALYVDAYVAPEFVFRSLTTQLPESEKLLASRDTVETPEYAVSTGLRASLVLSNGLAIRTGLVYSQTNERAQFDSLGMGGGGTEYKWRLLPNGQRDTYQIIITTVDGIFRKIRHNQYRSIDIPLQIGYETPRKHGWSYSFNGGVNINIAAWQKADIVGTDLRQLNVSSSTTPNPVFRTQLGMSFIGSVAAYRQLTRGLQLVIEPSFRYGLQPITRSDYALKQQYAFGGLMVGLRLRL